ncbi:MAG TPA: hypothetical protein VK081_00400 [Planctomycetota bacterium]|nr:hypothetical protein [Planctomycetota bacterium]
MRNVLQTVRRRRAFVWLACCVLLLLPAAGLNVCFAADHVGIVVDLDHGCPCGDHDDEPCSDVSIAVPDFRDDRSPDLVPDLGALALALAPAHHVAVAPPPRTPPPAPVEARPGPDRRTALRRSVVLLV